MRGVGQELALASPLVLQAVDQGPEGLRQPRRFTRAGDGRHVRHVSRADSSREREQGPQGHAGEEPRQGAGDEREPEGQGQREPRERGERLA